VRPDNSSTDYGAEILSNGEIVPGAAQNFTVAPTNGSIRITGYTGPGGDVVIPRSIHGLPVTAIGAGAFSSQYSITSVSLPDTITDIGPNAFAYCYGLTTFTVPNSVKTICDQAFYVCQAMTNIFFGKSVSFIGFAALRYCSVLTGVYFAGDAPVFDPNFDFYNTPNAVVYYLPGTVGWDTTLAGQPTAPWLLPKPVILSFGPSFGFQNNVFGFIVSWATNRSVVIEARSDFGTGTWLPLRTNTLEGGWLLFTDAQAASYPARFYRVRAQ
jgi:hypothetical protein